MRREGDGKADWKSAERENVERREGGGGHPHLKVAALAGRLKPTKEQANRNNSEGGRLVPLPLPGQAGLLGGSAIHGLRCASPVATVRRPRSGAE